MPGGLSELKEGIFFFSGRRREQDFWGLFQKATMAARKTRTAATSQTMILSKGHSQ